MAQTLLTAVEATGWTRSMANTRLSGATPKVATSGAQDGDQFRWDGHVAGLVGAPVLQPSVTMCRAGLGPAAVDLGPGLLQGEAAPLCTWQVAVLAARPDHLAGPERSEVHAGIERHEPLPARLGCRLSEPSAILAYCHGIQRRLGGRTSGQERVRAAPIRPSRYPARPAVQASDGGLYRR